MAKAPPVGTSTAPSVDQYNEEQLLKQQQLQQAIEQGKAATANAAQQAGTTMPHKDVNQSEWEYQQQIAAWKKRVEDAKPKVNRIPLWQKP